MSGIIKRRKTTEFAQIQNSVLRNLEDIRSIGLIAHLMSMPSDWKIKKTHLYSKFGRGPVSSGITELEEKKYWVHIIYRDGSKNLHYYHVSDIPFHDAEVREMIKQLLEEGFAIRKISSPFLPLLDEITTPAQEGEFDASSSVDFQQLNINRSNSTVENRQLLNKKEQRNRKQRNNNQRNIVNLQETPPTYYDKESFQTYLTNACHEIYPKYALGRWSKKSWEELIHTFVKETIEAERYKCIPITQIPKYAEAAILNMCHASDLKSGRKTIHKQFTHRPVPLYDWITPAMEEKETKRSSTYL